MSQPAFRRAQVYLFLSQIFLYPSENWVEDLPLLAGVLAEIDPPGEFELPARDRAYTLADLQAEHRLAFGLTGSQCYETEFGLPNEFRQSQEMADIAGFYKAFGFEMGGPVRERPDHLATELEFMYILSLKEAYAEEKRDDEQAEICREARVRFLEDHLGQWMGLFSQSLARSAAERSKKSDEENLFLVMTQLAWEFVQADAARLGIALKTRHLAGIRPTPLAPDLSCAECPANQGQQ